jgi:DNA repair protein RecN (Recombination protein N)
MLTSLAIRSFAIIDRLDIAFGPGLNVLTGETGAGKSIIMDALNVILGGRAGAELVRAGAERASVDAVFDLADSPAVAEIAAERGYDVEDGQLLLSREISAAGKSAVRIGGRPGTVGQLKELGEGLVDLHGQHEHQSLMAAARHLDILDTWGGRDLFDLRARAADALRERQRLEAERRALETDARERAHLLDLYQFQVNEINEASLRPGEEEELEADVLRLANAQRLGENSAAAAATLTGEDGAGVPEALAAAMKSLEEAAALDDRLSEVSERVSAAYYELEEAARDLARYQDAIEVNPERLELVQDRLELLRALKRKYGDSIEEVLEYGRETAVKLDNLTRSEERGQELDADLARAAKKLDEVCAKLTARRKKVAEEFARTVVGELRDLAMERTRFEVAIEAMEPTARGADRVEFLLAANPGEPLRPLARIASGGEISRVMLAVKSAMARKEPLPTMVFDEIDVGVGGRTGVVIADKLASLGGNAQILCITHLPQIASRGGSHFYIEKRVAKERTSVTVVPLSQDQRVDELSRMLGGANITETVRQHAREMLAPRA